MDEVLSGEPLSRAVAADALGRAPLSPAASPDRRVGDDRSQRLGVLLSVMLNDDFPAVRHLAWRSLRRLMAGPAAAAAAAYDPSADLPGRARLVERLGAMLGQRPSRACYRPGPRGRRRPRDWRIAATTTQPGANVLRFGPAAMVDVSPRRFGKYVLLKPIARGGMAELYLAATGEPGFQKFCVIKKMVAQKDDATSSTKATRFVDEAKLVLRLSHANLVSTFEAGELGGDLYIAMELVEGKDLRDIWNRCVRTRTRIPLDVALYVGREIARALSYVHSYGDLGLVHRDVAPPNILLSYFGEVKLTDFGLARSALRQEQTAPGVVFGRASYLAPEQARGEVADARTDIYTLGIVLWELLTGSQYLQLANVDAATAMSLVRHPPVGRPSAKAPWISAALDALLMRALAPNRDDRFSTAEEMRQALSEVMATLTPRADVERAAAFVRGLYGETIREEREQREQLLAAAQGLVGSSASRAASAPALAAPAPFPLAADTPATGASRPVDFPKEESAGVDFTGRIIDHRYRVIERIGEGGMGKVYLGEHADIGKEVAIKILHPAYSHEQDLVERFRREARAASRIGHPNIIDVTDYGSTEEGCAYFVMEYLDGIDLADVLSHERRLEGTRACQIAVQICRALAAAHAAGVVHRDLKPENIFLVSRDGKADFVKVLDFGIARSAGRSRLTNPGVAMGTPEYMAPEQARGGPVDKRSDIYSVGALLYEMVTGSPPQLRDGELVAPRALRKEVPVEIDRTIMQALEPDLERRYQTMTQLEYDIVKGLWGRARAVNELLGLRVMRRRGEMTPQRETPLATMALEALPMQARRTPLTGTMTADARHSAIRAASADVVAGADSETSLTGAMGELVVERSATDGPTSPSDGAREVRSDRGFGAGRRFVATFAVLTVTAALAIVVYRRGPFPWNAPTAAGPAQPAVVAATAIPGNAVRTQAELRARRLREETAELERLLAGDVGPEAVPALKAKLARLREEGGESAAALAGRAAATLIRSAERAFDAGDLGAGIALYRLAPEVDPRTAPDALGRTLDARWEAARAANDCPAMLRWARARVGSDGEAADATAHARLAEALAASDQDVEAAIEYKKALASSPDDPVFTRGLANVEKRLGARHRGHGRGHHPGVGRPAVAKAARVSAGLEPDSPSVGDVPPATEARTASTSAPAEPAAEQE